MRSEKTRLKKLCSRIVIVLLITFFGGMLFLTFNARNIHNRAIPHVKVTKLKTKKFNQNENGKESQVKCYALPKDLLMDDYYVLMEKEFNGEKRCFAQKIDLSLGSENEDYYPILNEDVNSTSELIISSDKTIKNNCEVQIVE